MDANYYGRNADIWVALYEHAIAEADPEVRRSRLQEAEKAILERARVLDQESGEHEAEAQALEEAAAFIREMKLATQTDGVGKQLEVGDKEQLPRKRPANARDSSPFPRSD